MKAAAPVTLGLGLLFVWGHGYHDRQGDAEGWPTELTVPWASASSGHVDATVRSLALPEGALRLSDLEDNETIEEYCVRCHNDRRLRGNMSLEGFDATAAAEDGELAERLIRKLRAGMMPPSGARRA